MFKKMLSAFSVGALALSLLFVKEAKADQVTEGRPAPEDHRLCPYYPCLRWHED